METFGTNADDSPMKNNRIITALREARVAMAGIGHFAADGSVRGVTPRPAASLAYLSLSDTMPAISSEQARDYPLSVTARPAGVTQSIFSEVLSASRVAQAGALIIPIKDAPAPVKDSAGTGAWYSRASRFAVVRPAVFAETADGDDATEIALPVLAADINLAESASHSVRFRLPRSTQKAITDEVLQFEIQQSITRGLASLADKVMLDAVAASTPSAYSLAAAAAAGARFAELKAIVGTAGNGASVNANGNLVAAGLPAELTDQAAATYAGIWSRSAIAVDDEIRVLIERRDTSGAMTVTVFATMQALLPSPDTFWTVGA